MILDLLIVLHTQQFSRRISSFFESAFKEINNNSDCCPDSYNGVKNEIIDSPDLGADLPDVSVDFTVPLSCLQSSSLEDVSVEACVKLPRPETHICRMPAPHAQKQSKKNRKKHRNKK